MLYKWDPYCEGWDFQNTTGVHPAGLYDGASTSASTALYAYGGTDGINRSGSLHKLDTTTREWTQLACGGGPGCPMEKIGCQMVTYGEKLMLFGGYGVPSGPNQPGAEHIKNMSYSDGRGWTNELHCFHFKEGNTGGRAPLAATIMYGMILQESGHPLRSLGQGPLPAVVSPSQG